MANTAQAKKRARQAEKHRGHNASQRSALRTLMKRVVIAVASGSKDTASEALRKAVPVIDRAAQRGLIHRNAAARYKSNLNRRVHALA
ncbi:MAG: 30S ribosomal protein S20 [Gammaproteobacteria bacterium]|nr:30S ribosomal protein S20 [Gammaproteobacteria bacterium]